jgi:CheY-like chemotaxis protein
MARTTDDLLGDRLLLLVDDDTEVREYIAEVLRATNPRLRIVEVGNGKEALKALETITPDVIMLDLAMPIMDGYAVLEHLQSNPKTRYLPVLVLTGYEHPDIEIDVLLAGASDFLNKPIHGRELIVRLHLIIRSHERQIEFRRKLEEVEGVLHRVRLSLIDQLGSEETSRILSEALRPPSS